MWNYIKLAVLGGVMVLAGLAANYGRDLGYQIHALIFMAAAAATFLYTLRHTGEIYDKPKGYLDGPVRFGVIATAGWGVVGFLVGTFIAFQLAFPQLNFDFLQGYGNFGRTPPR
jgi:cytochrome c oxidase cbb3-type subunit 1